MSSGWTPVALAGYRVDLEARRRALLELMEDPTADAEAWDWVGRLAEVEVLLMDLDADPFGYLAWMVAEANELEQAQVRQYRQ